MRIVKPKLRFKEFQHEWERVSFTDCCDLIHGFQFRDEHFSEIGFPVVKIGNLLDTGGLTFKNVSYVPEDFKVQFERFILYPNDILMALTGGTLGKVSKIEKNYGVIFQNYRVGKFVPKENAIKDFIYFILQSKVVQARVKSLVNEAAQPNFGKQDFDKIKVGIPSIPEQQKIASFLSAIDEKIQQLTRKKELLEQYKNGLMQQLFSGKLRFKDRSGKVYPKWEEKRLGDVGEVVSGLTYSPTDINGDGVLVLRSSNVQDRRLTFDDNVYVKVEAGDFNPVKENDILICVRNGSKNLIGKNALINKEVAGVAFGAFMTIYRSDFNLYLFHYFDTDSYKDEVHKNLGATINSINGSDLKKFKIPFPSIAEQQKIANFLSAIDTKIENVTTQINQTQSFKKGLLQQMFV